MTEMDHVVVGIVLKDPDFCDGCCLLRGVMVAECRAGFQPENHERHVVRPQECRDGVLTVMTLAESEALRHAMDETFVVMQRSWQEQLVAQRAVLDSLHKNISTLTRERDGLRHERRILTKMRDDAMEVRNDAVEMLAHFTAYPDGRPYAILCKRCGAPYPVQLGRDGHWYSGSPCCCPDSEDAEPCPT